MTSFVRTQVHAIEPATFRKLLPYIFIVLCCPIHIHRSVHLIPRTVVPHGALSVDLQLSGVFIDTRYYTSAAEPSSDNISSHTDSNTAAVNSEASSKTKSAAKAPDYTCPDEIDQFDIFVCKDCGGAVDPTPYLGHGEPNARCAGVGLAIIFPCFLSV